MRVIVCGGRDFKDYKTLCETLAAIHDRHGFKHLWHGNASGADRMAGLWGAQVPGLCVHPTPAQWKKHGKRAGPIRNQQMLGQGIDLVIAFPGGRGTADMVSRAKRAGVQVVEVSPTHGESHD